MNKFTPSDWLLVVIILLLGSAIGWIFGLYVGIYIGMKSL